MAPDPEALPPPPDGWLLWHERWRRYGWVVAVASFAVGLASFLLIERQEKVAQALVVILPLSWAAMFAEGWVERWQARRTGLRVAPLSLLRLGMQQVHQESFFLTLPFFLATTTWQSWQAWFTGTLVLAGLLSMVDPLYHRRLTPRPWAYFGFHALAVFLTVLTAAPMLWHLTTAQSLQLAALLMALSSIPAAARALPRRRPWRWPVIILACAGLGTGAWLLRWAIPPATLWVSEGRASWTVDVPRKEAGPEVRAALADDARRHGLFVWTAIRAPRGLHETVAHRWLHDGVEVDRVALRIEGGRTQGYRAWSHKRSFADDPRGDWEVQVVTEGGQLIGVVRFELR